MAMIKNVTVELGPYDLIQGGQVIGIVDNVTMEITEATEEELEELRSNPVLLLIKPLSLVKGKGAKHR